MCWWQLGSDELRQILLAHRPWYPRTSALQGFRLVTKRLLVPLPQWVLFVFVAQAQGGIWPHTKKIGVGDATLLRPPRVEPTSPYLDQSLLGSGTQSSFYTSCKDVAADLGPYQFMDVVQLTVAQSPAHILQVDFSSRVQFQSLGSTPRGFSLERPPLLCSHGVILEFLAAQSIPEAEGCRYHS